MTGLSLIACGWLGEVVEPPTIFLLGGLGGAVCALVGLAFGEMRRAR